MWLWGWSMLCPDTASLNSFPFRFMGQVVLIGRLACALPIHGLAHSNLNLWPSIVRARDPWGLILDPKTLVWNEVPQTLSVVPQDWFRPWGLAVAWWSRMKVPPSHIMSEQHVRQKLQIFPRTCMVPQCFVRLYSFMLSSLPSLFQFSSSMSENGIWRRQT